MDTTNFVNALRKRAKAQSDYNKQLEQIEAQFPDWQQPIENMLDAANHGLDEVESVLMEGSLAIVSVKCYEGWCDGDFYLITLEINADGTLKAMYDSRD